MTTVSCSNGNETNTNLSTTYRHYPDGQPNHAGDVLEFFDGNRITWTPARIELIVGECGRRAVLCTADGSSIVVIRLHWPIQR